MSKAPSIVVNRMNLEWNEGGRGFNVFGVDSILFWVNPSLVSMLRPLQEELGEDIYSRLVAFESSKGTYEDYNAIVSSLGDNFVDGFHSWGDAVSAAGWGTLKIESIDWDKKEASVRIDQPWELKVLKFKNVQNQVPFMKGKVSGIFSQAFKTNCRAEVVELREGESATVLLHLAPSKETLEEALNVLHSEERLSGQNRLRALNSALRRNQGRLLDVIDTVGEFVWETDRHLVITHATDKASEILGLPGDLIVGKSWVSLLGDKQNENLKAVVAKLANPTAFAEGEFTLQLEGRKELTLHMRIKQLQDFSGNHLGYVGSARDISHEKILEATLSEQQKASEFAAKMATLGEMAGGMAHEINTPLATITLLVEQLQEDLGMRAETRETLNAILETTSKIDRIIQGLRTFARDATQDPKVMTPLAPLIEDTLVLGRARLSTSNAQLKISPVPSVSIPCRPTQIMQVLMNLFNNAFDAVTGLSERWVRIDVVDIGSKVQIRVSDSGRGVPPEVQEKMMNPFYTTKPIGKGTGMGLSISKGIVESHGGRFFYDPHGPHTCFVVELPKTETAD